MSDKDRICHDSTLRSYDLDTIFLSPTSPPITHPHSPIPLFPLMDYLLLMAVLFPYL
jgi:hypothetical protein